MLRDPSPGAKFDPDCLVWVGIWSILAKVDHHLAQSWSIFIQVSTNICQVCPDVGHVRPTLADLGRSWVKVGPMLAVFHQTWPTFGKQWPMLAPTWNTSANLGWTEPAPGATVRTLSGNVQATSAHLRKSPDSLGVAFRECTANTFSPTFWPFCSLFQSRLFPNITELIRRFEELP